MQKLSVVVAVIAASKDFIHLFVSRCMESGSLLQALP